MLTKFQNLKIIYTEGKNLAFPDLLSRQVPQEEARKFQIEHKTVPKDIRFYTSDYKPINYSILHCDEKKAPPNTSYPVIAHIPGQKKKILNITDEDFSINDASDDIEQTCSATYNIADSFRYGRQINQFRKMSSENVSTESLSDHTYEEIPEEVHAVDDGLDDKDWLELQKGNVDISLIQELEQAKEEYKQRTHMCDLVEPTTLHTEVVKVSCKDLLQKLTEFTKQAQLDADTILREQIDDPILQTDEPMAKGRQRTAEHKCNQAL